MKVPLRSEQCPLWIAFRPQVRHLPRSELCQKQTHAPQQTACALQVQVTKMAAQLSGNAFTGAVDDAISEGFSEGRGHKFES
jgi:hypothetical protein